MHVFDQPLSRFVMSQFGERWKDIFIEHRVRWMGSAGGEQLSTKLQLIFVKAIGGVVHINTMLLE